VSNKPPTKLQVKLITHNPLKDIPLPKTARKCNTSWEISSLKFCRGGIKLIRESINRKNPTNNMGATKQKITVNNSDRKKLVKIVIDLLDLVTRVDKGQNTYLSSSRIIVIAAHGVRFQKS